MKKILLSIFAAGCIANALQAQDQKKCGTTEAMQAIFDKHPEAQAAELSFDEQMAKYMAKLDLTKLKDTRANKYIIPIVFHVLHTYGSENISDDQIFNQMAILNEDFNKRNADTASVIPLFRPIIGDSKIEFRLAKLDPQGNCTNGIDRIYTYKAFGGNDQSKLNSWNSNNYLNVWVSGSIGKAGVAGYAYKPATGVTIPHFDGIIILNDYIGNIGSGSSYSSRALTHEIGHYLGLDHTWGATNEPTVACGDDGVLDTPITKGHNNCNNLYDSTCTKEIIENVQNFMEYSYCSKMYTIGQGAKMQGSLDNPNLRGTLVHANAMKQTGIDSNIICKPKADFWSNRLFTCAGSGVIVKDYSYRGATGRTWSSATGTFSSNNTASPTVTFANPGWHEVTMVASNPASLKDTLAKKDYFYAADNTPSDPFAIQDFEGASSMDKWPTFNYFNNIWKWQPFTGSGQFSSKCIKYNSYYKPSYPADDQNAILGDYDDIISPAYDLSSYTGALNLQFATAAASLINPNDPLVLDSLLIQYSTNCGASWSNLTKLNKSNLFNTVSVAADYNPTSQTDWVARNVVVPAAAKKAKVFFRFRYAPSEYSNNFYIDNIRFSQWALPIDNITANSKEMTIYPNPANNADVVVNIPNQSNHNYSVQLTDIVGKVIYTTVVKNNTVNNTLTIGKDKFGASGIYFVTLSENNKTVTSQKLIVE